MLQEATPPQDQTSSELNQLLSFSVHIYTAVCYTINYVECVYTRKATPRKFICFPFPACMQILFSWFYSLCCKVNILSRECVGGTISSNNLIQSHNTWSFYIIFHALSLTLIVVVGVMDLKISNIAIINNEPPTCTSEEVRHTHVSA